MAKATKKRTAPGGGLRASERKQYDWQWERGREYVTEPVRCEAEEWYLIDAKLREVGRPPWTKVVVNFIKKTEIVGSRCVQLLSHACEEGTDQLLGWVKMPEDVTHVQLCLPDAEMAGDFEAITLHQVAERDPKCHPLSHLPRWDTYQPPFSLERVLLPKSLESLIGWIGDANIELWEPTSKKELLASAVECVCILDPAWVKSFDLTLSDLEKMAERSWLIVDLTTMAKLVNKAGVAKTRVAINEDDFGIMSARVEYSDVPTRGFAQQDVFPYGVMSDEGFEVRVLKATNSWKQYADENGFATFLSSETPFERRCGDVLMAACPVGKGELITTDLPWLVAGQFGTLLAPRLAHHLLRMLVGLPIRDTVEYWNRWEDASVLLRDIADMPRRWPGLQTMRWQADTDEIAHIGLSLADPKTVVTTHLVICTGRIDQIGVHDGIPPEPMMIFMKWLSREIENKSDWAKRFLANLRVTWQFDSAEGLRNVVEFSSAGLVEPDAKVVPIRVFAPSLHGNAEPDQPGAFAFADMALMESDPGLQGDGSLDYQAELSEILIDLIETTPRVR